MKFVDKIKNQRFFQTHSERMSDMLVRFEQAIKKLLPNPSKYIKKSPWIYHVNSGSCNGCDIEIIAALTPRYDVERFGAVLVGSPKHADILLVTGPVCHLGAEKLKRIYDQIANPKFVIAIGTCPTSNGIFNGSFSIDGPLDNIMPVDVYIEGCPPRPENIIDGMTKIIEKL
jgi:membrane-bound hydrogenase subunit mbhJ